jgi:hypothetical protein
VAGAAVGGVGLHPQDFLKYVFDCVRAHRAGETPRFNSSSKKRQLYRTGKIPSTRWTITLVSGFVIPLLPVQKLQYGFCPLDIVAITTNVTNIVNKNLDIMILI